jgi:hypothetical protein
MSDIPTLATTPTPSAPPAAPSSPAPAPAPAQRVNPDMPEWATLSAEQRIEQRRGPPNPRAEGHSPKRDQMEAAAARAAGEPDPAAPAPATDAPPASTEKHKIGAYEVSESEISEMLARQSAEDMRRATIPPTPGDYKLELPPDTKLPGGLEFRFDGNDPSMVAAKNWAHSKGIDQGTFAEMLALYAGHVAHQENFLAERSRAEIAKVGPLAPQRMDAIRQWVRSEVGDKDSIPVMASIVTSAQLNFMERIQQRVTSQGAASFSQSHRVAPDTNEIPGFDKMSFSQQRQAQDQLAARRR